MNKQQLSKLIEQVKQSGEVIVIDDYSDIIYSGFFAFTITLLFNILAFVRFKFMGVVIGVTAGYLIGYFIKLLYKKIRF